MNSVFMDVLLPSWVIVSQWMLLFAFGFLVIVMYRQIGYLQELKDVGSEREGLPIGEKAPAISYLPGSESPDPPTTFEPKGRWSLLVFADPGCSGCQDTLRTLERLAPTLTQTMRLLVVTTAEPAQIAAVDAFRKSSITIGRVRNEVPSKVYRTRVTPFAYLISPAGEIRAKGVAADEVSIRKLVRQGDQTAVNVEFIAP
jgi:hypothetical protein